MNILVPVIRWKQVVWGCPKIERLCEALIMCHSSVASKGSIRIICESQFLYRQCGQRLLTQQENSNSVHIVIKLPCLTKKSDLSGRRVREERGVEGWESQ